MSRRYSDNRQSHNVGGKVVSWGANRNRNFVNNEMIFVPKNHPENPAPPPSLTNSRPLAAPPESSSSWAAEDDAGESISNIESKVGSATSVAISTAKFVNYLPQDEAVAVGLSASEGGLDPMESQMAVDLLNEELSSLLKMNPRAFWEKVASDKSLDEFLKSFLQFRSRWYDFPYHSAKGTIAGVVVGEGNLSRRVFMVLFRMSSNRDPKARSADSLNTRDHEVILQDRNMLDLPNLLDICAIYGHENEDLTRKLVRNALKAQLHLHENLPAVASQFMSIVYTMQQRCISSLEDLFSADQHGDNLSSSLCNDLLQVMDFMNDAIVSMDSFVTAYKPAAAYFSCPMETSYGTEELLVTLARLHDTLLPSFERAFCIILAGVDADMVSDISISLKTLSVRLVSFGWKLLYFCYMSHEAFEDSLVDASLSKIFPAFVDDPAIRAEVLFQALREISGVLLYAHDNQKWKSFLQDLDGIHHLSDHLQSLQNARWMVLDDEQLNYMSEVMNLSLRNLVENGGNSNRESSFMMDEGSVLLESKINHIKDLFPEYGRGFLSACLEAYNDDAEEVIQRILEGTLHKDLQCLDTFLECKPAPKSSSLPASRDKGKGKIEEHLPLEKLQNEHSVSSSPAGKFVRKSNTLVEQYDNGRSSDEKIRNAALSYEYDDEYDDSYDDLGLSIADSSYDDSDILNNRMISNDGESSSKNAVVFSRDTASKKKPQFYVKDGKNYSYKVAGSVAVANSKEASLVNLAQRELIHGLGRGGNIPLGAVKELVEYENGENEMDSEQKDENSAGVSSRGRGRRHGGRGSGQYRKDRAFKKHFAGVSGI